MNEEKKTYSVVGTVTIGTDEYRNLIEEKSRLEHELDEEKCKSSEAYWKNVKNENKVKELEKNLELYKGYVNDGRQSDFKLWKLENMSGEEEE